MSPVPKVPAFDVTAPVVMAVAVAPPAIIWTDPFAPPAAPPLAVIPTEVGIENVPKLPSEGFA